MNQKQKQAMESKKLFIQSAYQLIVEKGYHNVTVQDICQKSEKSIGAFYHHFATKEDVVIAAYKRFDDFLQENYHQKDYKDWKDAIAYLLDAYLQYTLDNGLEFAKATIIAQLSIDNDYITDSNRIFYQCVRNALLERDGKEDMGEASEQCNWLMRTVRGSIFAWVMRNGEPSLMEMGRNDYWAVLEHISRTIQ